MSLHAINQKPLGARQREVLMLAEYGDVGILRGASAQRKALVSKGMITADRNEVTDLGELQLTYEHARQAPLPFLEVAKAIGNDFYRPAHTSTFALVGRPMGHCHGSARIVPTARRRTSPAGSAVRLIPAMRRTP